MACAFFDSLMAENNANRLIRAFSVISFINNMLKKKLIKSANQPDDFRIPDIILIYFSLPSPLKGEFVEAPDR